MREIKSHITVYLSDAELAHVLQRAKAEGTSQSGAVARLIELDMELFGGSDDEN